MFHSRIRGHERSGIAPAIASLLLLALLLTIVVSIVVVQNSYHGLVSNDIAVELKGVMRQQEAKALTLTGFPDVTVRNLGSFQSYLQFVIVRMESGGTYGPVALSSPIVARPAHTSSLSLQSLLTDTFSSVVPNFQVENVRSLTFISKLGNTFRLAPTPTIQLLLDPPSGSIPQGGATSTQASLISRYGFSGLAVLSSSNVPPKVGVAFDSTLVNITQGGAATTNMRIAAEPDAPPGTYPIKVEALHDGKTYGATYTLTINPTGSRTIYFSANIPSGQQWIISVDGTPYPQTTSTSQPFTYPYGSAVTFSYQTPVDAGEGARYALTSISHTSPLTVTDDITVTAAYKKQYLLTVTSPYGSTLGQGWYDSGEQATFSITSTLISSGPNTRHTFTGWIGTGAGSYTGPDASQTVTMNNPVSENAAWQTQHYLSLNGNPPEGGTITPASGWHDEGSTVSIHAAPNAGYFFAGWSGSYTGSDNPSSILITEPKSITAAFSTQTYAITFQVQGISSDASGAVLTIDGSATYAYTQLPVSFTWGEGSTHTYSYSSPVASGIGKRYVWSSTSGLVNTRFGSITVQGDGSITASYGTEYYLTVASDPPGGGTVSPASGWHSQGSVVTITASPNTGYIWNGWTGSGSTSYTGPDMIATVTVNSPISEVANFKEEVTVTIDHRGSEAAVKVIVDGVEKTLPYSFTDQAGSSHNIQAPSTVPGGAGTRYAFTEWSGGSSSINPSLTITLTSSTTYTANYKVQHQLAIQSSPSNGGTTSPEAGIHWYDSGTTLTISAYAAQGFAWKDWTGSGTGSYTGPSSTASITISGPSTQTANFQSQGYTVTFTAEGIPSTTAWSIVVDGQTYTQTGILSFAWSYGSSHTFSYTSTVEEGSATRYLLTSTSASSPTTIYGSETITGNYKTQHYLKVVSDYDSPYGEGWYDKGATALFGLISTSISPSTGTRHIFTGWSGSGQGSYTGTSPTSSVLINGPIVETAIWKTQYYLTISIKPNEGGSASPPSGWYDAGTTTTISATPKPGYLFQSWSGSGTGSYTGTSASATISFSSPISETANFEPPITITIDQEGSRSLVSAKIDGVARELPHSFTAPSGSTHTIELSSTIIAGETGTQYVFTQWSGGSTDTSTAITVSPASSTTYTANFKTQFLLTVTSPYGSTSGTGWHDAGSTASFSVSPTTVTEGVGTRYVFKSWSGPYSGTSPSSSIVMNAPATEAANWETQYYLKVISPYDSPTGEGWYAAGSQASSTVSSPATGGSGVRYVATGFTGSGSAPSSGTATSVSFTINSPSTISWNWKTQYYLDVSSPYASVSGSGWYDSGSTAYFSVSPTTVPNGEGTRHVFIGWSGSGSGSYSGSSPSSSVLMNNPISESANWKIQYYLTMGVSPSGAGTVSPSSGWIDAYSSVTISASANSGYTFSNWAGSGTGHYSGLSGTASITMYSALSETAYFTPNFDFSLSVSPAAGSIAQGKSGSTTITVSLASGSSEIVALSASGLPTGTFASFTPNSGAPYFTSTMTITVGSNTFTGTYLITITGSSGSRTHSATYSLTVTPGDLSVSVSPTSGPRGSSATISISNIFDRYDWQVIKWDDGTTLKSGSNGASYSWSTEITIPSSASLGAHTITVNDYYYNGGPLERVGTTTFTVTNPKVNILTNVYDYEYYGLSGVKVTIQNLDAGVSYSTTSNQYGWADFNNVEAGRYIVTFPSTANDYGVTVPFYIWSSTPSGSASSGNTLTFTASSGTYYATGLYKVATQFTDVKKPAFSNIVEGYLKTIHGTALSYKTVSVTTYFGPLLPPILGPSCYGTPEPTVYATTDSVGKFSYDYGWRLDSLCHVQLTFSGSGGYAGTVQDFDFR